MQGKSAFKIQQLPYFFLIILSFYPIMKEAIASVSIIVFAISCVLIYRHNFYQRFEKLGIKALLVNVGFYLALLFSCLYSSNIQSSFLGMQSSLLILVFPIIMLYFFPRVDDKTVIAISLGYVFSNLVIVFYFFNLLVDGMAVDRAPELLNSSILEKIEYLNNYPYEFAVSKAYKHLKVIFESHPVYLSLNFCLALVLALYSIQIARIWLLKIFFLLSIPFLLAALIYCQSVMTLIALSVCLIGIFPLSIKNKRWRLAPILMLASFALIASLTGFFGNYKNSNTQSNINFIKKIFGKENVTGKVDKRIYIYQCAYYLARKNFFIGHGAGDVQDLLDDCYDEKGYVVAEFNSVGSRINSHNYYFHVILSSGLVGLFFLGLFFFENLKLAIFTKNYPYVMFLIIFSIGLLTENLLVRTMGVFPFAIFNGIFSSRSLLKPNG